MIKFDVAQENYLMNSYPSKLDELLGNRVVENEGVSSQEYLYVFQEIARAVTRMYRSGNRFFETLMLPNEAVDFYYLERMKNLNTALSDAFEYFNGNKMTPKVAKALSYLEQDDEEGEQSIDSMPRNVPLSLAVVDADSGSTELVTLVLDDDGEEAVIIDEEGQEFTVPKEKIQSVQMLYEVPDAIQNVSNMQGVSNTDLTPADMPENSEGGLGGEGEGAEVELSEDEMTSGEEIPEMGDEMGENEMPEPGEEVEEKPKKKESKRSKSKKTLESFENFSVADKINESFTDVFTRSFEETYVPKTTFGYSLEEDIPMSMLKNGLGKLKMGSLYEGDDEPEATKIANKEDLKETTFKGGYRSDFPKDTVDEIKKKGQDKTAVSTLSSGGFDMKYDSEIKYENRFSKKRVQGGPKRALISYK